MKLWDLLSSCSNTWKGLLENNKDFKAYIMFEMVHKTILSYILHANYYEDERYLLKYRNREVICFEMIDKNTIKIFIEGEY